jgi:hypothetical protein
MVGDRRIERAGVADTGGAAVAGQVEAERIEIALDIRLFQIVGHDLGARRQRGLHPRLDLETLFQRFAGNQARADQNGRVRGVGAGGDRGNHHIAIAEIMVLAVNVIALVNLIGTRCASSTNRDSGVEFRHRAPS